MRLTRPLPQPLLPFDSSSLCVCLSAVQFAKGQSLNQQRESEKNRVRETKTETTVLDSDANASSLRGGAPPLFHPFVHSFGEGDDSVTVPKGLAVNPPLYLLFSSPLSLTFSVQICAISMLHMSIGLCVCPTSKY